MTEKHRQICGIVMPISGSDEKHSAEHWIEVREAIVEAIEEEGYEPRLVWEDGSNDIIQGKILQNLFQNDMVICDISTENSNVMVEMGIRLSTKLPTIIIAEKGTKPPFDIGTFNMIEYDPLMKHSTTKKFKASLRKDLKEKMAAKAANEYTPFLESYTFQIVEPDAETIGVDEKVLRLLTDIQNRMGNLELHQATLENFGPNDPIRTDRLNSRPSPVPSMDAEYEAWAIRKGFLPDEEPKISTFSVGDDVIHPKFGVGKVISVNKNKLEISFKIGNRRVIDSFVEPI